MTPDALSSIKHLSEREQFIFASFYMYLLGSSGPEHATETINYIVWKTDSLHPLQEEGMK